MTQQDTENPTGLERWVSGDRFQPISPISKLSNAVDIAHTRIEASTHLPLLWQRSREMLRNALGIHPQQIFSMFGEQATGLQETTIILAKRLLAAHALLELGVKVETYSLHADVTGSEAGMKAMTLPDPYTQSGTRQIGVFPGKGRENTALNTLPPSLIDIEALTKALAQTYGNNNPRLREILEIYRIALDTTSNIAQAQDTIRLAIERNLGIDFNQTTDTELDRAFLFNAGGWELLDTYWQDILQLSRDAQGEIALSGFRVPENDEAPFYAIRASDIKETTSSTRGRVIMLEDGTYSIRHPHRRDIELDHFTREDIRDGKIQISLRAIPRAIMFALLTDILITGGGAQYNQVVAKVFKQLTGVDYPPIIHMDLADENGNSRSTINYNSVALRKPNAPFLKAAESAVQRGLVSLIDFYLSIRDLDLAKSIIHGAVTSQNFSTATVLDLTSATGVTHTPRREIVHE